MEQEVLQIAQHMAWLTVNHDFLLTFRQVVHHRFVRIELCPVLVEVSHFQLGTHMNTSAIGLQLAQHQLEQRGFTAAVWTNQRNFIATLYLRGEISHQHFAVNLVVHVFHFKDDLTGSRGLFDLHLRAAHHFTTGAAFITHRFQRADAAFVTGTTGFNPLTDPHLFLRQFAVEFGVLQFFNAQRLFFFYQVLIVITRIGHQVTTIEIDDAGCHVADERTVVRDENDRSLEGLQEAFEPIDGFNIQVVRRFIKQQNTRCANQRTAQRGFTQPATGKRCQFGIRFQAQLIQYFINTVFQLPQPVVIQLFLDFRQLLQIFVARIGDHQMRNIMIALEINRLLRNPFGDEIVNASLYVTRRILLQTRHNQILLVNDTPVVQPQLTVEDFHQRRFARAVTAYEADAFVVLNVQFGIIEKRRVAERQPGAMHTN